LGPMDRIRFDLWSKVYKTFDIKRFWGGVFINTAKKIAL
jgi:hypothetical protein